MRRRYRRSARLRNARAGPCQVSNRPGGSRRDLPRHAGISSPCVRARSSLGPGQRLRRRGGRGAGSGARPKPPAPGVRGAVAARRRGERERKTGKAAALDGRRHHRIGRRRARSAGSHHSNPRHQNRSSSRRRPSSLSGLLPPSTFCSARSAHCPRLRRFTPFGFTPIDTDLALSLIRFPPPRLTPLLCAWAVLHRFTWQVEEGSPRRKPWTPFLESPGAEPKDSVRRGGGVVVSRTTARDDRAETTTRRPSSRDAGMVSDGATSKGPDASPRSHRAARTDRVRV